jgi:hypothetical protein
MITTYPNKPKNAPPHRPIGTLSPPALIQHNSLIRTPSYQVRCYRDAGDDAENSYWGEGLRVVGGVAPAGGGAAHLEEVGAAVGGADEGYGGRGGEGGGVAEEGEDGGFCAGVLGGFGRVVILAVFARAWLEEGGAPWGEEGVCVEGVGGDLGAGRAVGVV